MPNLGTGLSTFENVGKTFSLDPIYKSMMSVSANMAKAKADAAKEQKKEEELAMAKLTDFAISDKNKYTQKQLPVAMDSMRKLIADVANDKKMYPNTWTNLISQRILAAKEGLNTALQQSDVQREIEKLGAEGYVVPKEWYDAVNTKYGDMSNVLEVKDRLADFGIYVGDDGSVTQKLAKPKNLTNEFFKLKSNDAAFGSPTLSRGTQNGVPFVKTSREMTPEAIKSFKDEMMYDPGVHVSYMADPDKHKRVMEKLATLQKDPAYASANPLALKKAATAMVISDDIDAQDKTDIKSVYDKPHMTINVGGDKPQYMKPTPYTEPKQILSVEKINVTPVMGETLAHQLNGADNGTAEWKGVTYYLSKNKTTGKYEYHRATMGSYEGFNPKIAWVKQGGNQAKVEGNLLANSELYSAVTKAPLTKKQKDDILNKNLEISNYIKIGNKLYASVEYTLPVSGGSDISIDGLNSFLVEAPRGGYFDQIGAKAASTAGEGKQYESLYDFFNDHKGQKDESFNF